MALRSTVRREEIVAVANRMIAHLAESGTKSDADKREAIIAVTDAILSENGAYAGFRYLNEKTTLPPDKDGWSREVWDETRVAFY
jgi:hypothetical protein